MFSMAFASAALNHAAAWLAVYELLAIGPPPICMV